jgi:hypothetical protein
MDDAFQTPPQLATMPSIGDVIRISKKTLISLLLDLPILEPFVRSNMISESDSDSATLNFIHELGRALSNARIISSAPKASPKKRLYSINPCPTESSLQLVQPFATTPRAPTRLAAGVSYPLSSFEPQKLMQVPQKQDDYVDSRRQEMIKTANAMKSLAESISTHMNRILTQTETNLDSTEGAIIRRSILESIQWDHTPHSRRSGHEDSRRKRMIEEVKNTRRHQDPYYLTRMARHPPQNHPFVFIRGEINDIETETANYNLCWTETRPKWPPWQCGARGTP